MPLQFTWEALWSFHESLESQELKDFLQDEVVGQGWLYRQPARTQTLVLEHAPDEFVDRIVCNIKPEVAIKLGQNPFLKKNKEKL